MAKSKTEICNLAVSWLGGNQIFSLEADESLEARLCRANYAMTVRATLEEREWTFAVKREVLTPLAEDPPFGYGYQFQMPTDLIRVIGVYNPRDAGRNSPRTIQYLVEGGNILCDLQEIDIKYIFEETNTVKYTALFDQAVAAHLAMNISVALTENASMQQAMAGMYLSKLDAAAASDGLQGSRERLNTSQLEESRRLNVRAS